MDWFAARGIPRTESYTVLLSIPDIRQATDYDCGAAAVDAVAEFCGLRKRGPAALANPVQGMAPDTVEAVLRSLGLTILSGTMRTEDLRHLTRTGRPVLCPITVGREGHWVVVCGVERGKVYYHCPTHGAQTMAEREWLESWVSDTSKGYSFARWGIAVSRG